MSAIPARGEKSRGLLRVVSNDELKAQEDEKREEDKRSAMDVPLVELSSYCSKLWQIHKQAKITVEQKMLASMRQRYGEYTKSKLMELAAAGGSKANFRLTETKCRAAISWILEILLHPGALPFGIEPTKLPEIPAAEKAALMQELYQGAIQQALASEMETGQPVNIAQLGNIIKQQITEHSELVKWRLQASAKKKAANMEQAIEDLYQEGGFYEALIEAVDDIVTLKAGGIRGPVLRRKLVKSWDNPESSTPTISEKTVVEYERMNPFHYYPSPNARNTQDGDSIYHHVLSRKDLFAMVGVPGYIDANIRQAIRDYGRGGGKEWLWTDTELGSLRDQNLSWGTESVEISALEFWVSVPGSMLMEFNVKGVTDPEREYEANIWKVGPHVIRAVLNSDELGRRPFAMASFIRKADSVWGTGLPETIEHDADGANVAFRALINNAAFCSGPMVEENIDRLAYGDKGGNIHPYKVYKVRSDQMLGAAPAVRFYQPKPVVNEMIAVLREMSRFADDHSGVPAYAHGNENVGGAGDTASGLNMLMTAASRGIKSVVTNISAMVADVTERTYDHLMMHSPDPTIKGDCKVVAKGNEAQISKEQNVVRRREILRETNNPVDIQIMGLGGRKFLLEETLKGMDFDVHKIWGTQPELTTNYLPMQGGMGQAPAQGQPVPGPGAMPNQGQIPGSQSLDAAGNASGGAMLPSVQAGGMF